MNQKFRAQAELIYYVIEGYKKVQQKWGPENCKEGLIRISEMLRGLDNSRGANWASKAIIEQNGGVNPIGWTWSKRKIVGGLFEHAQPIYETRTYLLENDLTIEETVEYLWNDYAVCWITYEEDKILRGLGYSKNRPGGWKACYAKAGIEIVGE